MDMLSNNLRSVRPEDIEPRFDWERHLPASGTMAVDFEERVNYLAALRISDCKGPTCTSL
jgi:hypothetical protein